MKILFVCRGNVGRSQMAEAYFRQLAGSEHIAHSAGTEAIGSDGTNLDGLLLNERESSKYVIECLKEIGIDTSDAVIKKLTPNMVDDSDEIVSIVKKDAAPDYLIRKANVTYWDIVDPDEQTLEFHRQTRNQIEGLVKEFIESRLESSMSR